MARKTYTYDEVIKASTEYFDNDDLAAQVFADKYALRQIDSDGVSIYYEKTPTDMHRRLASEFARIEKKYPNPMTEEEIFDLFDKFKYVIPQGSPMSIIGNPFQVSSISNCVVLPKIFDSYGGIMYADQQLVQLSKRRCGNGMDISPLRPRGNTVENSALTTDGIGVFMERFSNSIKEVGQSGRRGALMLTINVHHPEVLTFVNIKADKTKVTGANVSVFLTDEFMEAVKSNKKYEQRWPVDSKTPSISKMVDAREVWSSIIHNAWANAEPGLMFIDKVINYTPPTSYEGWEPHSTNPCSEIAMNSDTCRLIAVNMYSFVDKPYTKEATFNYEKWEEKVGKAQRLMDDMVDLEIECMEKIIKKIESDPEPAHIKQIEIETWQNFLTNAKIGRRTGLGCTAVGDTIAALDIKYGSDESVKFVDKVFGAKKHAEYGSSIQMGKERGAFSIFDWKKEKNNPFIVEMLKDFPDLEADLKKHGRRNIAISTMAPTGSVSIVSQTTAGIEPAVMETYTRKKKVNASDAGSRVDSVDGEGQEWQHFPTAIHGIKKWMEINGETDSTKSPYHGCVSHDLKFEQRVKMQGAAQRHIDHAISSTVNLPKEATEEDVAKVYMSAWKSGCKGITVYRDGSRTGVLVKTEDADRDRILNGGALNFIQESHAPRRPEQLPCDVHSVTIKGNPWRCFVSLLDGKPYEIFTGLQKDIAAPKNTDKGFIVKRKLKSSSKYDLCFNIGQEDEVTHKDITHHFSNDMFGTNARMISMSLRHGIPLEFIVEQLQRDDNEDLFSFHKVVARVLKKYIRDGSKEGMKCKSCGEYSLIYQEGCSTCTSCGSSKCS